MLETAGRKKDVAQDPIDAPARAGDYVLEAKLAGGGRGAVYRARPPSLPGAAFAVKVMSEGLSAIAAARFVREMRTLGSLPPHPNVVRIHGGNVDAVRPF